MRARVQNFLQHSPAWLAAIYSIVFSFSTYFCMYAFRKPFTVSSFEGDWKTRFILAQVLGYTVSKFFGIKLVSEASADNRGRRIMTLMSAALAALVGFGLAPTHWKPFFLFCNGLPLGMIWGLVFSYLEGRTLSTLFGVTLSASFIVSSGVVKSVGQALLAAGVAEQWMPALAALLFFVPMWLSVWCLDRLPPPTPEEEALRVKRVPMDVQARRAFLRRYWFTILCLTALYMVLTAYRDFRDNFARELWDALGYDGRADVFSATELPIALLVLVALGGLVLLRDPRRSFRAMFAMMLFGSGLIGVSTFAFQQGWIAAPLWVACAGLGLFVTYVPFGSIFYDDLLAVTGFVGTAGFMIYISDAFGYVGSIGVMLYRSFGQAQVSWLHFFIGFSYVTSACCLVGLGLAWSRLRRSLADSNNREHVVTETVVGAVAQATQ